MSNWTLRDAFFIGGQPLIEACRLLNSKKLCLPVEEGHFK